MHRLRQDDNTELELYRDYGQSQKRLMGGISPSQNLLTPHDYVTVQGSGFDSPDPIGDRVSVDGLDIYYNTQESIGLSNGLLQDDRDPTLGAGMYSGTQDPQPVIPPELNSIENLLNASFPISDYQSLLDSSFNLDSCSQSLEDSLVPVPATVTPPPSAGSVDQDHIEAQTRVGTVIKLETSNRHQASSSQYQYHLSQQLDYDGNLSLGGDSSQDESQGTRIPSLKSHPGRFNFRVSASKTDQISAVKFEYLKELNKIFVVDHQPVGFEFMMDFRALTDQNYKDFSIEAVLYYTSHPLKQLSQCSKCSAREPNPERRGHVVQCQNKKSEYFCKKGLHNAVKAPLEKLQKGSNSIRRNYSFNCISSDLKTETDGGKWTVVFYLMNSRGNKELGRHSFNVKTCKYPFRDLANDKDKTTKLTAVDMKLETSSGIPPKRSRLGGESNMTSDTTPVAGPSRLAYGQNGPPTSVRAPVYNTTAVAVPESDSEPFTSSYDSPSLNSFLLSIARYCRVAQSRLKHPSPREAGMAKTWLKSGRSWENHAKEMFDGIEELEVTENGEGGQN